MKTPLNNGWTKCPQGELAMLSSRLWLRTLLWKLAVVGAVVTGTALSVASAAKLPDVVSSFTAPAPAPYGRCPSHECCGSQPIEESGATAPPNVPTPKVIGSGGVLPPR